MCPIDPQLNSKKQFDGQLPMPEYDASELLFIITNLWVITLLERYFEFEFEFATTIFLLYYFQAKSHIYN